MSDPVVLCVLLSRFVGDGSAGRSGRRTTIGARLSRAPLRVSGVLQERARSGHWHDDALAEAQDGELSAARHLVREPARDVEHGASLLHAAHIAVCKVSELQCGPSSGIVLYRTVDACVGTC